MKSLKKKKNQVITTPIDSCVLKKKKKKSISALETENDSNWESGKIPNLQNVHLCFLKAVIVRNRKIRSWKPWKLKYNQI